MNRMQAGDAAGRQGVAIIIVLGLMAVTLLAASAFTVFVQIERRASANYRHVVQARHILWAALASSINDINTNLDNFATGNLIYPDWNALASDMVGGQDAYVPAPATRDFVPDSLWAATTNTKPKWKLMNFSIGSSTQAFGRYAFIAVNTSGLLDANRVGLSNRWAGGSSEEIVLTNSLLKEIWGGSGGYNGGIFFRNALYSYYRYETLPELKNLALQMSPTWLAPGKIPANFSVYSLAPQGEYLGPGDVGVPLVNVGGDGSAWDGAAIQTALRDVGLDVSQATRAYANMLNFVDTDKRPSDMNSAIVEEVPMINEVKAWYEFVYGPPPNGNTKATLKLRVECWYPFVTDSALNYDLHCKVSVSNAPGNTSLNAIPFTGTRTEKADSFFGGTKRSFWICDIPVTTDWEKTGVLPACPTLRIKFKVDIGLYVTEAGKTVPVDQVPGTPSVGAGWPGAKAISLRFDIQNVNPASTTVRENWIEVVDPRFNYDTVIGGDWTYGYTPMGAWDVSPALASPAQSMGATNSSTIAFFDEPALDPHDDADMFIADRPFRTVGEMGHICYDRWQTLRLYSPTWPAASNYHAVYKYFTLDDVSKPVRGRVNVNTTNQGVLASVFYQTPEWETNNGAYPISRLTDLQAKGIAGEIIANGPYESEGDAVGLVNWRAYSIGKSEIQREGLIRNSMDLLTVRQNLFTILLAGESYAEMIGGYKSAGGFTLCRARGVAEVWRDPFRDASGAHRCFVRFFKIINE